VEGAEGEWDGAGPGVRITVEDTGIGIPPESIRRIFEKFEQADTSTTRRFGGTGLGLAITQELVQLMNGGIQVSSRPGFGSAFQVTLGLPREEGRREAAGRYRPQSKQCALVLSPTGHLRESLLDEMEDLGVRTLAAGSAEEARAILAGTGTQAFPSLILVDSALKTGPAEAFARWVRKTGTGKATSLVGLFGGAGGGGSLPADGLFDLVLQKPILERQVRRALRLLSGSGKSLSPVLEEKPGRSRERMRGRVLLVEDDETNRLMAQAMLKKLGLEFEMAANGLEALDVLERDLFDLVLMDCQMPEMDGFQATAAIRNRGDRKAQVPIVALTASALDGDRDRCLQAGMDEYVPKPLTLEDLRNALARWLPKEADVPEPDIPSQEKAQGADFDMGSALHRVGGNVELLREVGVIFFQAWEEREPQLRAAVRENDAETLERVAHRIKGSALSMSAPLVAEISGELELIGLQLRVEEADPVIERLVEAVRRFRSVFQEELAVEEFVS